MEPDIETRRIDDNLNGNVKKLLCANCRRRTNHIIEKSLTENWNFEDAGIQGMLSMTIVRCQGCELISFCKISSDSETYNDEIDNDGNHYLDYYEITEQFPAVETDFQKGQFYSSASQEIRAAHEETYKALCNGMTKLGAAGTRLIIELVCLSHNIKGRSLQIKIEKLHTTGTVTEPMKELLHNIRIFGNENVHTAKSPGKIDLINAWDAVNTLLHAIYGTRDSNRYYHNSTTDVIPF